MSGACLVMFMLLEITDVYTTAIYCTLNVFNVCNIFFCHCKFISFYLSQLFLFVSVTENCNTDLDINAP